MKLFKRFKSALLLTGLTAAPGIFNAAGAEPEPGRSLFLANCAECHQPDGQGIDGIYPALDGSEVVLGSGVDVALLLRIGRGEMPSFLGALEAAEMAAIINYVRNAWSNRGDRISPERVSQILKD